MTEAGDVMQTQGHPGGPEIFVGIVSAAGTRLDDVVAGLRSGLRDFNYQTEEIHLIETLHEVERWKDLPETPIDDRLTTHMDAGNEFRQMMGDGSAVALLGVGEVRKRRKDRSGGTQQAAPRCAYIMRGLKHPEEIEALRRIYGPGLVVIAVYSTEKSRLQYLTRRIAESRHDFQYDRHKKAAQGLLHRDQGEPDNSLGQHLRKTFHKADVFLNVDDGVRIHDSISRFMALLFGDGVNTPEVDEYGMYHAHAAALRSADLSRQVGAAIATARGDIIAVGTNDVPRAGGGQYWAGDEPDSRDYVLGRDSNDLHKRNLIADILERLKSSGWLSKDKASLDTDQLLKEATSGSAAPPLRGARVLNLIEFGRAVHAEMAALIDAARRGVPVEGKTLYSTTFPCHLCARHIVAAGITRVVYIEPYPKSLAAQLYPDSITLETEGACSGHVRFEPFVGVAPQQYINLFNSRDERKDERGLLARKNRATAQPRCAGHVELYFPNELKSLDWLKRKMTQARLIAPEE